MVNVNLKNPYFERKNIESCHEILNLPLGNLFFDGGGHSLHTFSNGIFIRP
jgi:hypothetical protein